jgi:hypothetical protein
MPDCPVPDTVNVTTWTVLQSDGLGVDVMVAV